MMKNTTADRWMEVWTGILLIFLLVAGNWLYTRWTAPPVAPAVLITRPEAPVTISRADAGPTVTRDQLLSNAQHVVRDWREADKLMAMYSDNTIRQMLASNQIIVVMPPCKDGHPWIDQTKVLIRYSCEGPMP